jgi:hypothetical protein
MEPIQLLVGRKVKAFEFAGHPTCTPSMKRILGKTGEILHCLDDDTCRVQFSDGNTYNYPYPEILDHLIEEEQTKEIMEKKENYKDLIGKEFTTFKFPNQERLNYQSDYDRVLDLSAVVTSIHDAYPEYANAEITLKDGKKANKYYPSEMIKQQIEEKENKSVDDILNEMKHLMSRI